MNILATATKEHQATMVDAASEHLYKAPLPINPLYKPVLMVMFQKSRLKSLNVQIVHEMRPADAEKYSRLDVGIFEAKFGPWTCVLNWTETKRAKLLPDYIGVDYGDVFCGIIGPHLTIRTCWSCGAGGWTDKEKQIGYLRSSSYNDLTGVWEMNFCPQCHETDWVARTIEPSRFARDCIAEVSEATRQSKRWRQFGGVELDQQIALEQNAA